MLSTALALPRKTLADGLSFSGKGLFLGANASLRILPADPLAGRFFVRMDLPGEPVVPALAAYVAKTNRSTSLVKEDASVQTVEHLLAALVSMGVDDARIELYGPEVPILDGSALPFAQAIAAVGLVSNGESPEPLPLAEPLYVGAGSSFVSAIPSPEMRFSYGISFVNPIIGESWFSCLPSPASFLSEIAPARTFATMAEVQALQERGSLLGGTFERGIVCDETGWLNGPLRFPNEPARHKLLDLLGDLALVPRLPRAHYLAFKAGHAEHVRLAKKLSDAG